MAVKDVKACHRQGPLDGHRSRAPAFIQATSVTPEIYEVQGPEYGVCRVSVLAIVPKYEICSTSHHYSAMMVSGTNFIFGYLAP